MMSNKFNTSSAPHIPATISVQKVMLWVLVALVPAVLAHLFYFGSGIIIQLVLCIVFAYLFEILGLKMRKQSIKPFVYDLSAPVTGLLFALCISPISPWYVAFIGMFFAMIVAKHLYGGLGHNVFNPAMLAFAVVLIAFPQALAVWLSPLSLTTASLEFFDVLQLVIGFSENNSIDSITAATPLMAVQTGLQQGFALSEIHTQKVFGDFGGMGWEWIANWLFVGGMILLYKRIISWHVPLAVLLGTIVFSLPFYLLDADFYMSPQQHIFSGGVMLAAFFIATDPTTGCSSDRGKLIFGAGVAILLVLIRNFGSFADGVAFAVLLMNMAAPLIDQFSIPKPYGKK